MKAGVSARVRIAPACLVAALLILPPALTARAQTNSTAVSNSATTNLAPAGETGNTAEIGKPSAHKTAHNAAHPKKKKTSFMHKMRDKAMAKVQKLFGSKQEPKQTSPPESKIE
jgi:hypothetical protein